MENKKWICTIECFVWRTIKMHAQKTNGNLKKRIFSIVSIARSLEYILCVVHIIQTDATVCSWHNVSIFTTLQMTTVDFCLFFFSLKMVHIKKWIKTTEDNANVSHSKYSICKQRKREGKKITSDDLTSVKNEIQSIAWGEIRRRKKTNEKPFQSYKTHIYRLQICIRLIFIYLKFQNATFDKGTCFVFTVILSSNERMLQSIPFNLHRSNPKFSIRLVTLWLYCIVVFFFFFF